MTFDTRKVNARYFENNIDLVPKSALTVGVGTILDAKEILIMISGQKKARAMQHGIEEGINHMWTISALQQHPRAIIVADEEASSELKVRTYRYFKDIEKENLDHTKVLEFLHSKVR